MSTLAELPAVIPTATTTIQRRMGNAKTIAAILGCSARHVLRAADAGLMPWGRKIGALRRWDLQEIDQWIREGCKPVRSPGRAGVR